MTSSKTTIESLFESAEQEGALSGESLAALRVLDLGVEIQSALGASLDDVAASEVVLVTLMPDDSGSIRFAGNSQAVRDGHNLVVEALRGSKQKAGTLVHTRYLNGEVLFPYCAPDQAVTLDTHNYDPRQGTPLYDQTMVLLGTVVAKTQEFQDGGVSVRTVTLIITDGDDQHSTRATARTVRSLIGDMLRTESHIVAAMGIDDGSTDFRQVFRDMGIEDRWILTPGNSASEIRAAFQMFSQSAVQVSLGGGASLGGFAGA